MELYNKEDIKELDAKVDQSSYYIPKSLFEGSRYPNIRLETKMAYVAILNTLLKCPSYSKEKLAFLKVDNKEIINTLAELTNKEVTLSKVEKYLNELNEVNLIEINKKDLFVYNIG